METLDWRIACLFVDKNYRKRGLAGFALEGALLAWGRQTMSRSRPLASRATMWS